jgi:hypothetical protein
MHAQFDLRTMRLGREGQRWLWGLSLAIVVVYGLLFLLFLNRIGPQDHDQFLVFHSLQYWNTKLFGTGKQWSPVMCSGLSLAGEPQVPFMSLSMLLTYLLGPLLGLKLATILYFVAGWIGAFQYAGLWLKQLGQRVLAASLFIGNGFFICRVGFGHVDFIPFLLLPMLLWLLHSSLTSCDGTDTTQGILRWLVTILLMAACLALAIDGSPVAIIHLCFWVGLYALVLSCTERSFKPVAMFCGAVVIAAMLDAGYLWPMLEAQAQFSRTTEDQFTSVLSLIWFALLPVRGKLLPANGNGHELSVFIGPVIGYLLWRYRGWLNVQMPRSIKWSLLIVSVVSIVLGMGSLKPLHVPVWLSPFDMLRPLPGFRSLGVTGRYWGFLALPLSLMGAAVLWRFVNEFQNTVSKWRIALITVLILQVGFQAETFLSQWWDSARYEAVSLQQSFQGKFEDINYVLASNGHLQGELISPTQGVLNCYDMDDFVRADVTPGAPLIKQAISDSLSSTATPLAAKFASWNQIHLEMDNATQPLLRDAVLRINGRTDKHINVVFNQAFNPYWHADGCDVLQSETGNLTLDCPVERLRSAPVEVLFFNKLSAVAADVSSSAWKLWSLCYISALCIWLLLNGGYVRKPVVGVIEHPAAQLQRLMANVSPSESKEHP